MGEIYHILVFSFNSSPYYYSLKYLILYVLAHLPDFESRLKILQLKAKDHRLASDVDLEHLARVTVGHNGADLETL
ncbi:hypothetical protein J6E39_06855, partial [bacterium]|nr:hypothetical protein [bacterium]